jgi:hypothetical protein
MPQGLLRVAVLDAGGEGSTSYEAHDLAWNYDGEGPRALTGLTGLTGARRCLNFSTQLFPPVMPLTPLSPAPLDHRAPPVVITTFNRLSTEWTAARSASGSRRHVLLQVGASPRPGGAQGAATLRCATLRASARPAQEKPWPPPDLP